MTDEEINEKFYMWETIDPTHKELEILRKDNYDLSRVSFHAGFRAAERLAKIEALEETLNELQSSDSYESFEHSLNYMIAELKEEGE